MAMIKCKECKAKVSSKAKTCPHCGIKNPATNTGQAIGGCLVLIIIVVFAVSTCSQENKEDAAPSDSEKISKPEKTPEQLAIEQAAREEAQRSAALKEAACKKDLQCWGDKNLVAASIRCDGLVEKLAKNSHEWTDGFFEPKFSHYRWKNINNGVITYIGDKIKFQNGFGAWINHVYECDFDPASESALNVRAEPGKL